MSRDELALWLRLTLSPGIGNHTARRLLTAFGLPEQLFAESETALRQLLTPAQTQALLRPPPSLDGLLERSWAWLNQAPSGLRHQIITLADPQYPDSLLQMEDPPLMVYALGAGDAPSCLRQSPDCLAIVGSRNPSPQGLENARAFARNLAGQGVTVVSGLALGIDGAAHEGALEGLSDNDRLATIAVVGTGLDRVYPRQHRALAHRIAEHGLLLSEYPLGTPPLAANFPKRNRLIAGLSQGTLVVEAALASGSLVTARLAAEQGKEVFAIPGSIHSPQSRGCHALIRQGAKLVETAQDVLEELHFGHPAGSGGAAPAVAGTAAASAAPDSPLLAALGHEPASLDALQARTGLATEALQAALLGLEMDGWVQRLPGGFFQRVGQA